MSIGNHEQEVTNRLKINTSTPAQTLLRRSGYAKARGE